MKIDRNIQRREAGNPSGIFFHRCGEEIIGLGSDTDGIGGFFACLPFDDGRRQCNCGVSCVREKQSREGARPRAPGERTGTQSCIFTCSDQTCSAPVITDREDAIPPGRGQGLSAKRLHEQIPDEREFVPTDRN